MRNLILPLTLLTLFTFITALGAEEAKPEINTILMHRTFKVEGPSLSAPGRSTFGTAFLFDMLERKPVLITAAHVFGDIQGDIAKLHIRKKVSEGKYKKETINLSIRKGKQPLWTSLPGVDIAVMFWDPPSYIPEGDFKLKEELLATDELLRLWEIHPGDELLCLGYPYGKEANAMGFPILRSGKIASFPIIPAKDIKSFLFDFEIFGGNSGGPVYFTDRERHFGGQVHRGTVRCIMGVVVERGYVPRRKEITIEDTHTRKKYKIVETNEESLGLAVVIPAYFIKEAIALLENEATEGK